MTSGSDDTDCCDSAKICIFRHITQIWLGLMPLITITSRNTQSTHMLALVYIHMSPCPEPATYEMEKGKLRICFVLQLKKRNVQKKTGNKSFDDNFGINRVIFAQICG